MSDLRTLVAEGERLLSATKRSACGHSWPALNCCHDDAHDDALLWILMNIDTLLAAARDLAEAREQRDAMAAHRVALRAENAALREQVTRLQAASTAELLKHREEMTQTRNYQRGLDAQLFLANETLRPFAEEYDKALADGETAMGYGCDHEVNHDEAPWSIPIRMIRMAKAYFNPDHVPSETAVLSEMLHERNEALLAVIERDKVIEKLRKEARDARPE